MTWLLSYQAPHHPSKRGINNRPSASGWYMYRFLRDDMGLDVKIAQVGISDLIKPMVFSDSDLRYETAIESYDFKLLF